jgi:hypothetical protein
VAQGSFSPSNAVCGLVNFSFCDQGVPRSDTSQPSSALAPGRVPPPPDRAEAVPAKSGKKLPAKTSKPRIAGNCASGWFTTLEGQKLQFIGVAKRRLEGDPRYVILHDGLRMEDNAISGYRDALQQFRSLCPSRVPVLD